MEIEVKMKVSDHEAVRWRLKSAGASHRADIFEDNWFFDLPDLSLRAADQGLRIRSEEHRLPDGLIEERIRMTYKGAREAGAIKRREEIEISVSDLDGAVSILERLGYTPTIRFEKRRQRWALNGCMVELDELPCLGFFIEIEGPSDEAIEALQGKLALDDISTITESYAAMLAAYAKAHDLDLSGIRF